MYGSLFAGLPFLNTGIPAPCMSHSSSANSRQEYMLFGALHVEQGLGGSSPCVCSISWTLLCLTQVPECGLEKQSLFSMIMGAVLVVTDAMHHSLQSRYPELPQVWSDKAPGMPECVFTKPVRKSVGLCVSRTCAKRLCSQQTTRRFPGNT